MALSHEAKEKIACAIEIISDRKRWTSGAIAKDARGRDLSNANDPKAVRFCAVGALLKCGVNKTEENAIRDAYSRRFREGVTIDNDGPRGRKKVIGRLTELMQQGEENGTV